MKDGGWIRSVLLDCVTECRSSGCESSTKCQEYENLLENPKDIWYFEISSNPNRSYWKRRVLYICLSTNLLFCAIAAWIYCFLCLHFFSFSWLSNYLTITEMKCVLWRTYIHNCQPYHAKRTTPFVQPDIFCKILTSGGRGRAARREFWGDKTGRDLTGKTNPAA